MYIVLKYLVHLCIEIERKTRFTRYHKTKVNFRRLSLRRRFSYLDVYSFFLEGGRGYWLIIYITVEGRILLIFWRKQYSAYKLKYQRKLIPNGVLIFEMWSTKWYKLRMKPIWGFFKFAEIPSWILYTQYSLWNNARIFSTICLSNDKIDRV